MIRYLTLTLVLLFAAPVAAQTLPESIARGRTVYEANCMMCHGTGGAGVPSTGIKPLDGSAIVRAEPWAQIRVVLDGVNSSPVAMSSWAPKMGDADMAAVITYTKNAWSNTTGQHVLAADIAAARIKPPQPAPAVWPSPVGKGTPLQVVTIKPDADDPNPAWKTPKCVAWWYYPDVKQPSGWRTANIWTEKPWYMPTCLAAIPAGLTSLNLTRIWTSAAPRSLSDAGESWAEAIWWQDHGRLKRPAPPKYIVTPYPGATYRATYPIANGVRGTTSNGRVLILTDGVGTPCDCALYAVEGTITYCSVAPAIVANCTPK